MYIYTTKYPHKYLWIHAIKTWRKKRQEEETSEETPEYVKLTGSSRVINSFPFLFEARK